MDKNFNTLRTLFNEFYSSHFDHINEIGHILKNGITIPVYYQSNKIKPIFFTMLKEYFMLSTLSMKQDYVITLLSNKRKKIKSEYLIKEIEYHEKDTSYHFKTSESLSFFLQIKQTSTPNQIDWDKIFHTHYEPKIKKLLLKIYLHFLKRENLLETEKKDLLQKTIKIINEFGIFVNYSENIQEIEFALSNQNITTIESKDIVYWDCLYHYMFEKSILLETMSYAILKETNILNKKELFNIPKKECSTKNINYQKIIEELKKHQ